MTHYNININGRLLTFDTPKVMGIINTTPDSFFADSRQTTIEQIVLTAEKMTVDGARFLDIGGMSSRPGAEIISTEEEIKRTAPAIEAIKNKIPDAIISIDTYRASVAEAAIQSGAEIINDIYGGTFDEKILDVAAKNNTPYICMHIQGTPQNMQDNPSYENVTIEVFKKLQERITRCREAGITDIIIDPGFGFGKTIEQNYQLLADLDYFQNLDCPILAGLSRKSMLYKLLDTDAENSLNATTAANTIALQKRANILRVHDVKEAVECVKIYENISYKQTRSIANN